MWMLMAWLASSKVEFLLWRTAGISSLKEKIGASSIEKGKNKNIRYHLYITDIHKISNWIDYQDCIVVEVTQKFHTLLVSFLKISGEGRVLEAAEEQVSPSSSSSELIISDSGLSNVVLPDITDGFCSIWIFVRAAEDTWHLIFPELSAPGKAAFSSGSPISAELHPCNLDAL